MIVNKLHPPTSGMTFGAVRLMLWQRFRFHDGMDASDGAIGFAIFGKICMVGQERELEELRRDLWGPGHLILIASKR